MSANLTFFQGTPASGCFSLYMSECYTQKNQVKFQNNLDCTKNEVFHEGFLQ